METRKNKKKLMIITKKATVVLSTVLACAAISASGTQTCLLSAFAQSEAVAQMIEEPSEESVEEPVEDTQADPVEVTPSEAEPSEAAPVDFQPASRERVEDLLEIIDADAMSNQILGQLIGQFRQLSPEVPDEWWDGFIAKALESDINELLIPIYERNYSAEEVEGLIEFYQSPVGQSLLAKTPTVTQESIAAGQAWGLELVEELIVDLEADGYEFPVDSSVPAEEPVGEPILESAEE